MRIDYQNLKKIIGLKDMKYEDAIKTALYKPFGTLECYNHKQKINFFLKSYTKNVDVLIKTYGYNISNDILNKITLYFNEYFKNNNDLILKNNSRNIVFYIDSREVNALVKKSDLIEILQNLKKLLKDESSCPIYKEKHLCQCDSCSYISSDNCRVIINKKHFSKNCLRFKKTWGAQMSVLENDYDKIQKKFSLLNELSNETIKEEAINGIGSIKLIRISKFNGYNVIEFNTKNNYEISDNCLNYLNVYYNKYIWNWDNKHKKFTKDMAVVVLEGYGNKNIIHWEVLFKDSDRKYEVINNSILKDYENQMKKII